MDYAYIEHLILSTKEGNSISKEKLIDEFTPLIKKISKTTFISNYTREDIEQECYLTLLKCIDKYNPKMHRFIGYATMAIRNNINYLLRGYIKHKAINSDASLTSTGSLEDLNLKSNEEIESSILYIEKKKMYKEAINLLSKEERELLKYVYIKNNSLKQFATMKNISYSTLCKRKARIKRTLKQYIEKRENE